MAAVFELIIKTFETYQLEDLLKSINRTRKREVVFYLNFQQELIPRRVAREAILAEIATRSRPGKVPPSDPLGLVSSPIGTALII